MCPSAQYAPALLQGDVGFDGDGICADDRPFGSSLALDFSTLSISAKNQESKNALITFTGFAVRSSVHSKEQYSQ